MGLTRPDNLTQWSCPNQNCGGEKWLHPSEWLFTFCPKCGLKLHRSGVTGIMGCLTVTEVKVEKRK